MLVKSSARRWSGSTKILADHKVDIEVTPDLPMLELDPVLFEQVTLQSSRQRRQSMRRPEQRCIFRAWQEEHTVKLQVTDEGSGISPEEIDRIFEKFHRAYKSDQVRAGTGLGLAIARGFVEAMGGTVMLQIGLIDLAPYSRSRCQSLSHRTLGHCRMSATALKVLVIDDEAPIRKLLRMGLGTQGYQTIDAPNGRLLSS